MQKCGSTRNKIEFQYSLCLKELYVMLSENLDFFETNLETNFTYKKIVIGQVRTPDLNSPRIINMCPSLTTCEINSECMNRFLNFYC